MTNVFEEPILVKNLNIPASYQCPNIFENTLFEVNSENLISNLTIEYLIRIKIIKIINKLKQILEINYSNQNQKQKATPYSKKCITKIWSGKFFCQSMCK
jgi:hypothetical protein